MRPKGTIGILVGLAGLVAVWQIYIWYTNTPPYVLPGPWDTLQTAGANLSLLAQKSLVTLEGAVLGLAAALAVALALAVVIVRWPLAEHVILTYALLVRTLPIVGVAPIITLVTGRGLGTSVLCVMVITVFSLLISLVQGFSTVPAEVGELAELYSAPLGRRLRFTLLPASMASLLQGLRATAPLAVLGALLAEWLDGFPGIGTLMITANADQEVQLLMAACLTAVLLSLVAYALVEMSTLWAAGRGYRVDEMTTGPRP
jgi:ABC-type nitrate/sulfonate/bicarbonate transport system permease component